MICKFKSRWGVRLGAMSTLTSVFFINPLLADTQTTESSSKPKSDVVQSQTALPSATPAVPATSPTTTVPSTHVQYVPEIVKQQLRDEIRNELLAQGHNEGWAIAGDVPEWTKRFTWEGDLRLRLQSEKYGSGNSTTTKNFQAINQAGTESISNPFLYTDGVGNVSPERDRFLARARLGTKIKVADNVDAGLRMSTGNTADPVSTNQTLGNYDNRYQIVLDRAWAQWRMGDHASFWGGRMANPFFSSELFWSPELGFDGVALSYQRTVLNTLVPYATIGAFPLQELASSSHDKWLLGAQLGSQWTIRHSDFRMGLAWYDYKNVTGVRNDTDLHTFDYTAPSYLQKGNTLYNIRVSSTDPAAALYALAGDYRLINVTLAGDFPLFAQQHLMITADYVRNVGWNQSKVFERTGIDQTSETSGYLLKLAVGSSQLSHRGEWQAFASYRHLGADAALDAFTETDFHLAGTNAKGYVVGGSYTAAENSVLSLRWLSSDEISGPPLAIDVLQIDMSLKF